MKRCHALTAELHDGFCRHCGAPCCRFLIAGYDRNDPARKAKCDGYVKYAVTKTAGIIERELEKDAEAEEEA